MVRPGCPENAGLQQACYFKLQAAYISIADTINRACRDYLLTKELL